jgi:hypothetical protein
VGGLSLEVEASRVALIKDLLETLKDGLFPHCLIAGLNAKVEARVAT